MDQSVYLCVCIRGKRAGYPITRTQVTKANSQESRGSRLAYPPQLKARYMMDIKQARGRVGEFGNFV